MSSYPAESAFALDVPGIYVFASIEVPATHKQQSMIQRPDNRCRLVIVEGIMGSGKSTTTRRIADLLNASGISASAITEGTSPHPIRFDWSDPWADMRPERLAELAAAQWAAYAAPASMSGKVTIVDGQLFHGNLTALFLLDADISLIRQYVRDVMAAISPLHPILIYFHQDDIDHAIRMTAATRGDAWVQYQTEWKLSSPHAVKNGFAGLEGLIHLYREYRRLTDQLYAELDLPKLSIENSKQHWAEYELAIADFLIKRGKSSDVDGRDEPGHDAEMAISKSPN